MSKILGLDLGTNSIGWALIDDGRNAILNTGVRIFPEGVDNLGEGQNEMSKNSTRRTFRQVRRQIFRRKLRKKILLKTLAKHNMCPLNEEQIKRWNNTGDFPDTTEMHEWLRENPYLLREKALKEKISLAQLGRILYQIAQHRGFLSNSRSAGSAEKEEGAIYSGDVKTGKIGIIETLKSIEGVTLGSYLATVYPKENKSYLEGLPRIRNRYTTRQMYIDEFEMLWERQTRWHTELNNELKEIFGGRKKDGYKKDGILFYQRPLRTQKFLIGKCSFEPKKTKCPASAIPFEKFRAYQFVNQIECDGKKLTADEKKIVFNFLLSKEKPKFSEIRKKLKKPDGNFNYEDTDVCPGTYTISSLSNKKFFGEKWFEIPEKGQEDIWHILYNFDDRDKLKQYAIEHWGFDEEKATKISKFNLIDGYANLSRKAILNILPFLEIGFTYDIAATLGGIKNAFGEDWKKLSEKNIDFILTNVPDMVRSEIKGGYIESLKDFLKKEFGFKDEQLKKLYHHSTAIDKTEVIAKLPVNKEADKEISNLRNPIVSTALFELRKLVNTIIDEYGTVDKINVELARDLKISKEKRNRIRLEQKRLERQNEETKKRLREHNQDITHVNILKYNLWEECQHKCPYTGKEISIVQLFSGEVQIEHIFPWSRSLDDSFLNKTLCFVEENNKKGNLTPFEYFTKRGGNKLWEEMKEKALQLFYTTKEFPNRYEKFKRFAAEKFNEDFISRQLNDTRFISREAKTYLEKICDNVHVAPGQITANLRAKWGLNSILDSENEEKTRNDHRHHAIDALVMACFKPTHLQEISKWNRYNRNYELKSFPFPWEDFRQDADASISAILVSHKQINRTITSRNYTVKKGENKHVNKGMAARGSLHEATVYGLRKNKQGEIAYHLRKPLQSLTEAMIPKIVDANIKTLVYQRLRERGLEISSKNGKPITDTKEQQQIFAQCFDSPVCLPNRNGDPVPVRKVRIQEDLTKLVQLKGNINQNVNPKNNHHILIYRTHDGDLKHEAVSFWIAVERKKQNEPIYKLPSDGKEIIAVFHKNDLCLLGLTVEEYESLKNNYEFLSQNLYKVQKVAGADYFLEICFRHHSDSRTDSEAKKDYKYIKGFGDGKTGWETLKPIIVKLSPTGKIEKIAHHAKSYPLL